ncbi:MAG TPA: DUF6297 family protein [Beutenbergiaceae bacterium]|nr:DUF6297 family protein [Beutenbergiaceae bacterium]
MSTGRDLRRLTRRAIAAHGGGKPGAVLEDLYTALLAAAISVALVAGIANEVAGNLRENPGARAGAEWFAWGALALVLGMTLGLAGRIGPIFLGAGYASWWLAAPVDRRGLLRPRLLSLAAVAFAAGAIAGIPIAILMGEFRLEVILGVGALAALMANLAAVAQVRGALRSVAPAGDGIVALALAPLAVGVVTGWSAPAAPWWAIAAVGLAAAAALGVIADRSMERISGAQVRERGLIAAGINSTARSFDTRELGFLLGSSAATSRPTRASRGFQRVDRPVPALIVSEVMQFARTPRHLIQFLIGALVPLLVSFAGWGTWALLLATFFGGLLSASALGGPARQAFQAPVLDSLWPLSQRAVRWSRTIVPSAAMMLLLAGVLPIAVGAANVAWFLLALLAAPVFAAGILRSAYRKPVDWSAPLITTPDGQAIPPGAFSVISVGPDLIILGGLPLWLAIGVFGPAPALLFTQAATSGLALLAASRTNDRRK